ncbi:MAG: siroheme synthase CysG [Paracoccaceae bacterium]
MDYLPIFYDIRGKRVLIDGGGMIAARRAERALQAGARVEVFDTGLSDEFEALHGRRNLAHVARPPEAADLPGCALAYGTTGDADRDRRLREFTRAAGVPLNVADIGDYCDFITPSIVDRSPLVIAITSGGAAPIIARILRAHLETLLPPAYGKLAAFFGGFRELVAKKLTDARQRRRFWETAIEGRVADLFLSGHAEEAEQVLTAELEIAGGERAARATGEIYLVGAGPGAPDLLTFRALRLMQRADVVLYDRLVGDGIIDLVRREAERIYVGKLPKQHTMSQDDISRLMVRLAKEGKRVLRLKGGDPFIFGRGGEEIEMLAEHGIPFQVVPGITAASGCSTHAGIPLTHRNHAQSCVFVTAHGKDGVLDLDWEVLVRPSQTVVVYMGLANLASLCDEFIAHGANAETPAALVDNGTRESQRVVVGTVRSLHRKAQQAGVTGPAIIIIGDVVRLHDDLKWHSYRPAEHSGMRIAPVATSTGSWDSKLSD